MRKKKKKRKKQKKEGKGITVLAIGEKKDHDTFWKIDKEKRTFKKEGFDYLGVSYSDFRKGKIPEIKTDKLLIMLSFPFKYWNKYIEHKKYRGVYGNISFFRKFEKFFEGVRKKIRRFFPDKKIAFINYPTLCSKYRDKLKVMSKLDKAGILHPKQIRTKSVKKIRNKLAKGQSLYLKPRFGSMGKGITFLSWSDWQTNFAFRKGKIISRKSDHGWTFKRVTGNANFLKKLLNHEIMVEEAVDALALDGYKLDLRVYTFMKKLEYIYPRKNKAEKVTTNISQGAKGDPEILRVLPKTLIEKVKKTAEKVSRELDLNLAGIDIIPGRNFKDIYVLDVNVFPGLPKRRTYNIARSMVEELSKRAEKGKLNFQKGRSV